MANGTAPTTSAGAVVVGRRYCCALSVRGALRWSNRKLRGMFAHEDGRKMDGDEVREVLMDQLAQGREVLPFSACDQWDYKTGCKGHPITEEAAHV